MATLKLRYVAPFLFLFGLSLAEYFRHCGTWEEGKPIRNFFTCATQLSWETLSQRPTVNGELELTGYCEYDGTCYNNDTTRFVTRYRFIPNRHPDIRPIVGVRFEVVVHTRHFTEIHCYRDGEVWPNSGCSVGAYVVSQPTCTGPTFATDGQSAEVICVSERVFPEGSCDVQLKSGSPMATTNPTFQSAVQDPSPTSPDDKQLTCTYTLNVQGEVEADYGWQSVVTAVAPTIRDGNAAKVADMPTLQLRAPALKDPTDSGQEHDSPTRGELTLTFTVTSNPAPLSYVLQYTKDGSVTPVTVSDYTATFTRTPGTLDGVMTLKVRDGFSRRGPSRFTLQMGNGVIGSPFSFEFSVVPSANIADDFCHGKSLGFHDHPSTCDHFVLCLGYPWLFNRPVVMPCPLGTYWDQSILTCNHKYAVSCS